MLVNGNQVLEDAFETKNSKYSKKQGKIDQNRTFF
jgi:hypothetical protein